MRELERIDRILKLLEKIWKKCPDFRFFQLIYILQSKYSDKSSGAGRVEQRIEDFSSMRYSYENQIGFDFFNIEDDKIEAFLEGYLKELK